MELETKIKQMEEEWGNNNRLKQKVNGESLPRPPESHTLAGHRDNITAVKFHPVYNLVVSASLGITSTLLQTTY